MNSLTPIVLIWILSALLGLYFAVVNLRESLLDRKDAAQTEDGLRQARMVVTNGYVFRNSMRVAIFAWWTVLGIGFALIDLADVPRLGGALGLIVTSIGWTAIGAQESAERRSLAAVVIKAAADAKVLAEADTNAILERTAASTERIAENTDKLMSSQEDAK